MRRTPKFLLCGVATSVALLLVLGNSVPPVAAEKAPASGKELEGQRVAVLEEIVESAKQDVKGGIGTDEDVHIANMALLAARLEYARTPQERIKICNEAVTEALEWEKVVQAHAKAGNISRSAALKAQARVLEAQIARANAEASK